MYNNNFYAMARKNTMRFFERYEGATDSFWESVAESLMDWMSDDEVGEWAEANEYLESEDCEDE